MKPPTFAVAALFLYAVQNVILERKLAHISPLWNLLWFYVVILTVVGITLVVALRNGVALTAPTGVELPLVIACGLLLFGADVCYVTAYHRGASLMTVTTIVVLMPVFASFIRSATGGGLPTIRQFIGWALAAIAVVLVSGPSGAHR